MGRLQQGCLYFGCCLVAVMVLMESTSSLPWPRGCRSPCGTLRTPGASYRGRRDETDHCFPKDNADHMVCCVNISMPGNSLNIQDPQVARNNPLYGPITRNSDPASYSWCTCSVSICIHQLKGDVAWDRCPDDDDKDEKRREQMNDSHKKTGTFQKVEL